MLASPIILYDHAELAPESGTAFFDALEVDELLSLRTMTLSEQEKREVRGTDPRAGGPAARGRRMPDDLWQRLHGTVRYLDSMTAAAARAGHTSRSRRLALGYSGTTRRAVVGPGVGRVGRPRAGRRAGRRRRGPRGSRVILRPGVRRADAYDLFLAGRTATVAAVLFDVDHGEHLAVTVDDDPGSDLKATHGRYLYFAPDEVEPLAQPRREPGRGDRHDLGTGGLRGQHLQERRRLRRGGGRRAGPPRAAGEVRVVDFGIRSVHLVYELLSGYDVLVLVDTVAHQEGPPGSLYLIEPDVPPASYDKDPLPEVMLDAHDLSPGGVMALVPTLGGQVDRILVVGVQPVTLEDGIGHGPGPRRGGTRGRHGRRDRRP